MVNQNRSRTNMNIPDDGLLGGDDLGGAGNGGNLKESTAEINQFRYSKNVYNKNTQKISF